jgi:hypothetical protein
MKITTIMLMCSVALSGCEACGYSSRDNDLIGQVKRVKEMTPIICGNYTEADISLGVMRNGVGSLSKEDVLVYVPSPKDRDLLIQANKSGALVDVKYDERRATTCIPDHVVTSVSIVSDAEGSGSGH